MTKIKLKDLEAMLDAKLSQILESKKEEQNDEIEIDIEDEVVEEENISTETEELAALKAEIEQLKSKNKEWERMWNSNSEKPKETAQPRKGWGAK